MLEQIEVSRKKKEAAVFKDLFLETPGWPEFIKNIDVSSKIINSRLNNLPYIGEDEIYGKTLIRDRFYIQSLHRVSDNAFKIQENLINFFNAVYNEECIGGTAFVNLAGNDSTVEIHRDQWDSIFWQCIGSTKWKIHSEGNIKPIQEFVLSPGDVAVIPSGVYHQIDLPEPRASIAYGYRVITKDIVESDRTFK